MKEDKVIRRLRELRKAGGGILTPDAVVADAMKANSPLRAEMPDSFFDNAKAAHAWRLCCARKLISRYPMYAEDCGKENVTYYDAPIFVRDPELGDRQGYRELATLASDEDKARKVLVYEFDRAMAMVRRCAAIAGEVGLQDEFEEMLRTAEVIQSALQAV